MIYFDNAATTCVFPEVVEAMQDAMQVTYGNPSAKHMKGIEAENKVKAAQELIAKTLRAKPKEILFTSGGTESNNTAIIGTAMANRRKGKHIITTKVEHASVYEPMYHLEEEGYEVTYLDVDSEGIVDLDQLEESIREDTILVSCMMVNNEIGAIEPIEEIAKIIKAKNPNTIFHVDAIQAYGKLPIVPKNMGIDLLSTSGHKIHGPKGIGFLYIKEGTKISPIIFGGGQQKGMRSGTENVPGIVGLAVACEKMIGKNYENAEKTDRQTGNDRGQRGMADAFLRRSDLRSLINQRNEEKTGCDLNENRVRIFVMGGNKKYEDSSRIETACDKDRSQELSCL